MLKGIGIWVAFHDAALARTGHTWNNLADWCVDHGISVILPRAGGTTRENDWNPVVARQKIRICHDRGLKVVPWHYSVPSTWQKQVPLIKSLLDDGADGVCIDAELEWEANGTHNHQEEAADFGDAIRKECGDGALIMTAPLPFINYHATYPYTQFGHYGDMVQPQFYWTGCGWPRMRDAALPQWDELIAKGSPVAKGFAPIGNTYGKLEDPKECPYEFHLDDLAAFDRWASKFDFRSYYSLEVAAPSFTQYLKPDLCTDLGKQIGLWKTGHYSGSLDGKFGPKSQQATKDFQAKAGLQADGVFGPLTRDAMAHALNNVCYNGCT